MILTSTRLCHLSKETVLNKPTKNKSIHVWDTPNERVCVLQGQADSITIVYVLVWSILRLDDAFKVFFAFSRSWNKLWLPNQSLLCYAFFLWSPANVNAKFRLSPSTHPFCAAKIRCNLVQSNCWTSFLCCKLKTFPNVMSFIWTTLSEGREVLSGDLQSNTVCCFLVINLESLTTTQIVFPFFSLLYY